MVRGIPFYTCNMGEQGHELTLLGPFQSEYGDQGVLAYAVHPGSIMTELGKRLPEEIHHRKKEKSSSQKEICRSS